MGEVSVEFKIAAEEWELNEIHRLNYRTFVEEIPQHKADDSGMLVDKFHRENTYLIARRADQLVGMLALRDKRPFSLDEKLPDLDAYLPTHKKLIEVRLLSVEKDFRRGHIFHGLMTLLLKHCRQFGYDLAVISGTVRQLKLYKRLGFVPFGPLVGTHDALYQPMFLTWEAFGKRWGFIRSLDKASNGARPYVNLLPGPVGIGRKVRRAFAEVPVSHRSEAFLDTVRDTKARLCRLTHAAHVEILTGAGTLANDTVGAQISIFKSHGLILSNGEFGRRLIEHATRWQLSFDRYETDWGKPLDYGAIRARVENNPGIRWIWGVHCETSTGVLNDLETLKQLCAEKDIRLCMDCISSIGTARVDLRGVHFASGVSGKGIGSFPGLALVFYNHKIAPAPAQIPCYLDLGVYAAKQGVPYTISSNLMRALHAAVQRFDAREVFESKAALATRLRARLRKMKFTLITPEEHASPAVITIALPREINSESVGRRLRDAGYLLSYRSEYLLKRNWIQICLMGEYPQSRVVSLMRLLEGLCESTRGKLEPTWTAEARVSP